MKKNIHTAKLLLAGGTIGVALLIGATQAQAQTIESQTAARLEMRGERTGGPSLLENLGARIGIGTGTKGTSTTVATGTRSNATTAENAASTTATSSSFDGKMMLALTASSSAEIETQIIGLLEVLRDRLSQLVQALGDLLK